jgi:hypothetical protein
MWTQFLDMHSGGGCKEEPYECIYIEADNEEQAEVIFYNRFGHSPHKVSCTCCGEDYSVSSHEFLSQLTGYHRNCKTLHHERDPNTGRYKDMSNDSYWRDHFYLEANEEPAEGYKVCTEFPRYGKYISLEDYLKQKDILVIFNKDVREYEKQGEVPEQGYVWVD